MVPFLQQIAFNALITCMISCDGVSLMLIASLRAQIAMTPLNNNNQARNSGRNFLNSGERAILQVLTLVLP